MGWGFPIKEKTAAEVGRRICSIIYTHGCPKIILSDQGREFVVKYVRFNNAIVVNTIQELFLSAWNVFFFWHELILFQLNTRLCSILAIQSSVTAAYHPKTNGLDENTLLNITIYYYTILF